MKKERTVTIPSLNNGNPFEVPKRKVKHTLYVLDETQDCPNYKIEYMRNVHLAYILLKEKFDNITVTDILKLGEHELLEIAFIGWENSETEDVIEKFRPKKSAKQLQKGNLQST